MQLLDASQVMMTNLHAQIGYGKKVKPFNPNEVRHLILNMIRSTNVRFRDQYGPVVICCDNPKSWRKGVFPYYKAHRKADRDKLTHIQWPEVYKLFDAVKEELKQYTHYPVIEVAGAEGDDVIAVLALADPTRRNIIVSGDRDFVQLKAFANVDQYDPIHGRFLTTTDAMAVLEEHIIRGDRNDGIPNTLSDDDTLVSDSKRQKKITEDRLELLTKNSVEKWDHELFKDKKLGISPDEAQRNWQRNRLLIDLRNTPTTIAKEILASYDDQKNRNGMRLFDYFYKYELSGLMDCLSDFKDKVEINA